jgi:hypothetical protein
MKRVYKISHLLMVALLLCANLWAKEDPIYDVARIAPELLENAEVVVRNDLQVQEIVSPSGLIEYRKGALTILKESALKQATLRLYYSKLIKVENIEMTVFDSKGVKVKRIKADEILDYSAIDGGTMYSDDRVKIVDPKYQIYPFTVEYSYTRVFSSAFYCQGFNLFPGYNTSVENAKRKLITPVDYQIMYKEMNGAAAVQKSVVDVKQVYTWEPGRFLARNPEPFATDADDIYPRVKINASKIVFDGYKGDCSSWQLYGAFLGSLLDGKDNLSPETAAKMQELTKNCTSDYDKIKVVYEYGQKKNRYISVQKGIGGLQPFDAATVDRLAYGDCKALSNYNKTLLEAVGIKAYYTCIEADNVPTFVDDNFVDDPFNHVVVCVPMPNDTLWLECTNPYIPCGYFGAMTHNRKALLINGMDSRLVHTSVMKGDDNQTINKCEYQIDNQGNANLAVMSSFSGIDYAPVLGLTKIDETDRRKHIIADIKIPNFQLVDYKIVDDHQRKPTITQKMNLAVTNCVTQMGQKMILKLNQYNALTFIPPYARKRESPLQLVNDEVERDTVIYHLPDGAKVESLPSKVDLESAFGSYHASCEAQGNTITYYREFRIRAGIHEPAQYNVFREFLEKIASADNNKCIIQKSL